jgi:hydrogenase maturation protein HypF
MLPSSPLHHLLLRELGFPVVATSGNLSDEPICTDEREALERLHGIADSFLVHDRPIVRPMDNSVTRVVRGREMILRRARGYAPLPVLVKETLPCVLATGADLQNAIALSQGHEVFLSQHIGDLETNEAHSVFRAVAADLPRLYDAKPGIIACDLHPDYLATQYAEQLAARTGATLQPIQHHWAHVLSCMAENEVEFPALGVAWDGTGYGTDGTIWGGEFLLAGEKSFERVAHFLPFRLPGGEGAVRQPRRSALGVLYEMGGAAAFNSDLAPVREFNKNELTLIRQMLDRGQPAPLTSSVGRLFDAVASLAGLRQETSFEAQAAMDLEFAIQPCVGEAYSFEIKSTSPALIDWRPMIAQVVEDVRHETAAGVIAAKFHNAMVEIIVAMARHVGQTRVVLTGGCFQNRYLTERAVQRLLESGFRPYWHQRVPTNDGGIALGQIVGAVRARTSESAAEPAASREQAKALA